MPLQPPACGRTWLSVSIRHSSLSHVALEPDFILPAVGYPSQEISSKVHPKPVGSLEYPTKAEIKYDIVRESLTIHMAHYTFLKMEKAARKRKIAHNDKG